MGSCFSKRKASINSNGQLVAVNPKHNSPPQRALNAAHAFEELQLKEKVVHEEKFEMPKEIREDDTKPQMTELFLVKHRKSNDEGSRNPSASPVDSIPLNIRTSSCTKEEVDAILIHCGRLSRSNSAEKMAFSGSRKYSGSKRSYDFDEEAQTLDLDACDADAYDEREARRDRNRQRAQRPHSPGGGPQGRRRTPSRERDQRSGSKERVCGSNSRRVSRSPGRRLDSTPVPGGNTSTNRPMKMLSVPATVAVDKPTEGCSAVKRVQVKKTIASASPRSMSPARAAGNNNPQQQQTLSRNSSRKGEHSPHRRNPLSEIDANALPCPQNGNRSTIKKPAAETKEEQQGKIVKEQQPIDATAVADDIPKPNGLTRSRSNRRSRDFDEVIHSSAYTNLLLEDIENFHQKNAGVQFNLPACLSKACSILEAVADLNSATGFEEKKRGPLVDAEALKYITVRERNKVRVEDGERQESSGSNSVVGGQVAQSWGSSWESSADSSDRWSSRSNSKAVPSQRVCEEDNGRGKGAVAAGKSLTQVTLDAVAATM